MPLSVIIPWKDRPELRDMLIRNLPFLDPSVCDAIIVNCGGNAALLGDCLSGLPQHIRFISVTRRKFNKSFALNIGVSASNSHALLFLDSDIILEQDLLRLALSMLSGQTFLTVAVVRESEGSRQFTAESSLELAYSVRITTPSSVGKSIQLETNRVRPTEGTRSGPGLIAVERHHFLAVGGMNSALEGWGWEDLDLIARLQFELNLKRVQHGSVVHLTHTDAVRSLFDVSREQSEQNNYLTCLANYSIGHFRGTYDTDMRNIA
jgi:glycosyltransferase involved in cell wall biosynthesis